MRAPDGNASAGDSASDGDGDGGADPSLDPWCGCCAGDAASCLGADDIGRDGVDGGDKWAAGS